MVKINPDGGTPSFTGVFRRPAAKKKEMSYKEALESMSCFAEVKARIQAGWNAAKVADFIESTHPEDFEKLELAKGELVDYLTTYRKSLTPFETVAIRMPEEVIKAKEKIDAGINVMEEMQTLYKIQKARIDIDVRTETKLGKLFKTTGNEIAIAAALLRDLAAIMNDLGVNKGNPAMDAAVREKLITDFGLKYGKESVSRVLNDPKAISKVLNVAESLFKSIRSNEAAGLIEEARQEPAEKPVEVKLEVAEETL